MRATLTLRRLIAGAALLLAVAVIVVVVVSSNSSPSNGSLANGSTGSGAATVQRRDLVETDTESGTLSYANPQTVYNRLSGTLTWLPSVGQVIRPGGTLFKVDGEPVLLMGGTSPAYRTLSADDDYGQDVLQLNRNLVRLGFNPDGIIVNDEWQAATTTGVELLQVSLGEAETGSLALGQIVFLPGDQLVSTVDGTLGSNGGSGGGSSGGSVGADTTVATPMPEFVSLEKPQGCDGSGAPSTTETTSTSASTMTTTTGPPTCPTEPKPPPPPPGGRPHGGRPHGGRPHRGGHHRVHSQTRQTLAALTALLKAEAAQIRAEAAQLKAERQHNHSGGGKSGSNSAKSSKNGSGSGSTGGSNNSSNNGSSGGGSSDSSGTAQAILQTSSTHLVVTVDLAASSQSEAVRGERVTVEMPAGNTVDGRIIAVSSVAQNSSGSGNGSGNGGSSGGGNGGGGGGGGGSGGGGSSGSSSTIPVTIALSGRHSGAGLDQAAVSVNFAQARAKNVLSIPVTALLAIGGGNYAVQAAAAPHKLIPVTTGLFAAGYVEISGSGIYPGLQVTDSQG